MLTTLSWSGSLWFKSCLVQNTAGLCGSGVCGSRQFHCNEWVGVGLKKKQSMLQKIILVKISVEYSEIYLVFPVIRLQ